MTFILTKVYNNIFLQFIKIIIDDKMKSDQVDDTILDDIVENMDGFALSRKQK